jgi:hypothetical protein
VFSVFHNETPGLHARLHTAGTSDIPCRTLAGLLLVLAKRGNVEQNGENHK